MNKIKASLPVVCFWLALVLVVVQARLYEQRLKKLEAQIEQLSRVKKGRELVYCRFDGVAVVGNYAFVSDKIAGACHDSGIKSPGPVGNVFIIGVIDYIVETKEGTMAGVLIP